MCACTSSDCKLNITLHNVHVHVGGLQAQRRSSEALVDLKKDLDNELNSTLLMSISENNEKMEKNVKFIGKNADKGIKGRKSEKKGKEKRKEKEGKKAMFGKQVSRSKVKAYIETHEHTYKNHVNLFSKRSTHTRSDNHTQKLKFQKTKKWKERHN